MKRILSIAIVAFALCNVSLSQTDSLWRGIFQDTPLDGLNYATMRDSLHFNILEGASGYSGLYPWDSVLLHNAANIRVIQRQKYLYEMSMAQQMVWEAEQEPEPLPPEPNPMVLHNFFWDRPDSVSAFAELDTARISVPGINHSGYVVRYATPNWEYHYERTKWLATFRLKAEYTQQAIPSTYVAKCIVYSVTNSTALKESTLTVGMFPDSGVYRDFVLPFTLNPPPAQASPLCVSTAASANNHEVDLRVYWYGLYTTYLDKVVVEDTLAHDLFTHVYDDSIRQAALQYGSANNSPAHHIFYLADEPPTSVFLAMNYVGKLIKDVIDSADIRSRTTTTMFNRFARFLNDAPPSLMMVDMYPITPTIPHPSILDKALSTNSGITWNATNPSSNIWGYTDYVDSLQRHLDVDLHRIFYPGAQVAKDKSKRWTYVPQLHGIAWDTSLNKNYLGPNPVWNLRPPSASEVRLLYNLGMVYGAKGFVPFNYRGTNVPWVGSVNFVGLVSDTLIGGYYTHHSGNTGNIFGTNIWTGYNEKWHEVAAQNARLMHIGDTLLALNWQGTKSWTNYTDAVIHTNDWSGIVTAAVTKDTLASPTTDSQPFVEVGHLKRGATDYLVVVNRRCATRSDHFETRDVTLTLNNGTGNILVTDIETNRAWVTKGDRPFTDRFQPGEGKIYRLQAATVSGTQTFPQLKFCGGGVLTLASNANITARGNMDTVNIELGSNAVFKADTGSTIVTARDSAVVFGSGSELQIAGLVNVVAGSITVPATGSLSLLPGAVLNLQSGGSVIVEGTLSATGSTSQPVVVHGSAEDSYSQVGFYLAYHSSVTLEHCQISDFYCGVSIDSCAPTIQSNHFLNCSVAISSDGWKYAPVIVNNTVDSCQIGFDVHTSSVIGRPVIRRDTIRTCTYGMVINASYRSIVDTNRISDNHIGLLIINSGPVLHALEDL
jgi:hypothetical protein